MFGSNGLRWGGKFFAFLGGDGELIIKLPAADAAALVEAGRATAIKTGRHTTREWVGVPIEDSSGGRQAWRDLLAASHDFVSGAGPGR